MFDLCVEGYQQSTILPVPPLGVVVSERGLNFAVGRKLGSDRFVAFCAGCAHCPCVLLTLVTGCGRVDRVHAFKRLPSV